MFALILAAGRGERMRPLTDAHPKPLLEAGGRALIEWQIIRLVTGGFTDLVINHAWMGAQIETRLGDGSRYGARIRYSPEVEALETLGGVVQALPLLGDSPFAVVSADIYTEYDYARLAPVVAALGRRFPERVAHFVLTDNPPYHPQGDMGLRDGRVTLNTPRLNYGNIAVFHPALFEGQTRGQRAKLFPWAFRFVEGLRVSGEHFHGVWDNVGTPEQLAALDARLRSTQMAGDEHGDTQKGN